LVLAHLQLARIEDRLGNVADARAQYGEFLGLWQQSDDVRQRHEAVREQARLPEPGERQPPRRKTGS
jgi:hypothetical protein